MPASTEPKTIEYVTDDVRRLIGTRGPRRTMDAPLSAEELRRFVHATMDDDPRAWDGQAAGGRYGAPVAPPLYLLHVFRRTAGSPDPLDCMVADPDWDGLPADKGFGGLPPVEVPLKRLLNGGTEAEFFRLARVGDTVSAQSRYIDIYDKLGRSGPMVLIKLETLYTNQDDEPLARITNTLILR